VTGSSRDPFREYRARLAALGFRPSSTRGQNFLLDPTMHRWIADAAAPGPADAVLEIGVGLGFLTRELAARAGSVLGVEIDRRLCEIANAELQNFDNVSLLCADALGGPERSLDPAVRGRLGRLVEASERFLVVSNLPYSVSGAVLAELYCLDRLPDRAVVLLQRELAERLAAGPGEAAYGGLSGLLQTAFAVRLKRTVPAEVFRPRPKVASAVVQLDRRDPVAVAAAADRRRFAAFVRRLFGQRRKTLATTLPLALASSDGDPRLLAKLPGELLARRAETLPPLDLVDLWRRTRRSG